MKLKTILIMLLVTFVFMFANGGNLYAQTGRTVGPLTQTKWNQHLTPFNNLFKDNFGITNTDCGNLSWAQIMVFHKHPARGVGRSEPLKGLLSYKGQIPSVNFNVAYDWNNMLNIYPQNLAGVTKQQQDAAAALIYHVAVSEEWIGRMRAMTEVFGYDKSIQTLHRRFYNDAEWEKIIKTELDAGRPVRYWGVDNARFVNGAPAGGQNAFVIDGYDNSGRFHINNGLYPYTGWGSADGWFFISGTEKADSTIRYFYDQRMDINIKPNAGGVPVPYEFGLEQFTAAKTTVSQNEQFTVTARVRNLAVLDTFPGGYWGVALVNSANNIVEIIGHANAGMRNPQSATDPFTINCFVPQNVNTGSFRLMIVARPAGGQWKIITRSAIGNNVPNTINVTVNQGAVTAGGGYGLRITYFAAANNRTSASQNERFNVSVRMRNRGAEQFPGGQAGAALVDNNGNISAVIGTVDIDAVPVGDNMTSSKSISCTVPNTVTPGRYQLRIVVRPNNGQWRIVTETLVADSTSINFEVR